MTTGHAAESGDPIQNPEVWVPRLARLVDRQRSLYEHVASLGDAQTASILEERTDDLLSILARRQEVIEEIARLNEQIAPFVRAWDRLGSTLSPSHRDALRQRFDAVALLVEAINRRDEADRARIEERRAAVRTEMDGISAGRDALGAYIRPATPGAVFHDSTG